MEKYQTLIGLISIAVAIIGIVFTIFFGLRRGLSRFREFRELIIDKLSEIRDKVSSIEEKIVPMGVTLEKVWDILTIRIAGRTGATIERNLENLGKVKITAQPGHVETTYIIEIEKPIFEENYIAKVSKQTELRKKEMELFKKESLLTTPTPEYLFVRIPSVDSQKCTEYMTFFLNWLNSTYIEAREEIKEFEEPILRQKTPKK